MKPIVETVTIETITIRLSGEQILALIPDLPSYGNATVEFYVPRGGDYSGMALPVTEEDPVVVILKRWS